LSLVARGSIDPRTHSMPSLNSNPVIQYRAANHQALHANVGTTSPPLESRNSYDHLSYCAASISPSQVKDRSANSWARQRKWGIASHRAPVPDERGKSLICVMRLRVHNRITNKGADYERPPAALCCDLMLCFTTFASSIKNARTILHECERHSTKTIIRVETQRARTQPPHRESPICPADILFRLGHRCVFAWAKGNNLFTR
jgi:hypothetical protein